MTYGEDMKEFIGGVELHKKLRFKGVVGCLAVSKVPNQEIIPSIKNIFANFEQNYQY